MSRKLHRKARCLHLTRCVMESLEPRQLLSANPSFLVNFYPGIYQSNITGMATPFQPATVNNQAGASHYGFATNGDYDGGGTNNDYQYGYAFSDTTPLSPAAVPMTHDGDYGIYNGASTKFYGGVVATEYNATGYSNWGDYPVVNNGGIWSRIGAGAGATGLNFESLVYWKKQDFLTGSETTNLTLDMATAYFKGTFTQHGVIGRWVIRDGSQFYISQTPILNDNANAANTAPDKYLQADALSSMKWAPYNPSGTDLHFDANGATWTTHSFTDITAVGYFAQKEYNETQSVAVSNLTAGTFTITFDGKTTAAIPYNLGVETNQNGYDHSLVSILNDTFGYYNLHAHELTSGGLVSDGFTITFDGGNRATSIYAYQDVANVVVNFDATATAAGASATVTETSKGGSVVRYDSTADAWMGVSDFEVSSAGRMNCDNIAVDTASYLGGASGDSSINATTVLSDGSILLGGTLANDPTFGSPQNITVNGVTPTTGTIVKLNAAGTAVTGIINIGSDIKDIIVRPDGKIVVAVSGVGVVVLNADAFTTGSVAWFDAMADIKRISVGTDNMVAALSDSEVTRVYSASGTVLKTTTWGFQTLNDIVLDTANHLLIFTGGSYYTSPVVRIPVMRAYDYTAGTGTSFADTTVWSNYEWSASTYNTYWGNLLSDSTGDRLKIGADGALYLLGHADGGASAFNWEPLLSGGAIVSLGAKLQGFDTYARPGDHSNEAVHYTFIGKYNRADGSIVAGNWELCVNGSTQKGNTLNATDIAVTADGTVYLTGSETSEQANRDGLAIDDKSLPGYLGYETFVMALSPGMTSRLRWNVFTTASGTAPNHRSGGNAIALSPAGKIIIGAYNYNGNNYTTSNALQSSVPGGNVGGGNPVTSIGYFAVLPTISLLPDAPTKLTVTAQGAFQASLTWQRNTHLDTDTIVERSLTGTGGWVQIADLSSYTSTTYTPASGYWDETVDRGTTYYYRVKVYNAQGVSSYSNVVSVTTPAPSQGPWSVQYQQPWDQSINTATNTATIDSNLKYTIHAEYDPWVNGSGLGGHGINRGEKYVGLVQRLVGDGAIIVHRASDSVDQTNFVQSGIAFQESLVKGESGKVVSMVGGQFVTWDGTTNTIQSADPNTINNPWWKLVRVGDNFSAYYSADGVTWTQAGTTQTVDLPDSVFVVIAGQSSYDGANTLIANFDNVLVSHIGGGDYSNGHNESVYVKAVPTPQTINVNYEGTDNNSAIGPYFNATGSYYNFSAGNGISGSGAASGITSGDGTMVYKNGFGFSHANDIITASQFVKLADHTANAQIMGLGLLPTVSSTLGGGSTTYIQARLAYGMAPAAGYALQVQKGNGAGTLYTANIGASLMVVGHWYKLTNTFTNVDGTNVTLATKLEDYGTDGLQTPTTVVELTAADLAALSFTDQNLTAGNVYIGYRGYSTAGGQYFDNFAVNYLTWSNPALQSLAVYVDVPGAPTGTPTYRVQLSAVDNLLVDLKGGDDVLTVDSSSNVAAIPAGGLSFAGGSGSDTLNLIGTSPSDAFSFAGGAFTRGSSGPLTYTGAETITVARGTYNLNAALNVALLEVHTDATVNVNTSQGTQTDGAGGAASAPLAINVVEGTVNLNATSSSPLPDVQVVGSITTSEDGSGKNAHVYLKAGDPLGLGAGGTVMMQVYSGGTAAGQKPTRAQTEALWFQVCTGYVYGLGGITVNPGQITHPDINTLAMLQYDDTLFGGPGATFNAVSEDIYGDVNGDFSVDGADLAILLSHYLTSPGSLPGEGDFTSYTWLEGDLNGDFSVDGADLALLLGRYLTSYDPSNGTVTPLSGTSADVAVSAVVTPAVSPTLTVSGTSTASPAVAGDSTRATLATPLAIESLDRPTVADADAGLGALKRLAKRPATGPASLPVQDPVI